MAWTLLGAIGKCYPDWDEQDDILIAVMNHLSAAMSMKKVSEYLIAWNNIDYRTFDDICELVQDLDI